MSSEYWQQVEKIFNSALERSGGERAAYLDAACGGDSALRGEVESLIANNERAEARGFLSVPAAVETIPAGTLPAGRVLDGKYSIERELGRGGMGAVYLATHLGTGRPVALKVIAPQYMANEEFVERFKREAKAAGLLRHPNVVNVTDFGFTADGHDRIAYLVMEYLDGCTLSEVMKQRGKLPLGFVIEIVEQVSLAINEAHRQGIIHRDLKPDNIWLEPDQRGSYTVKVLDFGLAKLRDTDSAATRSLQSVDTTVTVDAEAQTMRMALPAGEAPTQLTKSVTAGNIDARTVPEWLTRFGMVMGTPLYMSPEQCHGRELDARSDVYALGVITYEMLAGGAPFTGDLYQLIAKHSEMPPAPLAQKRPDIPAAAAAVVMKALAKAPGERPASALAFATALRANAEGDQPILREAGELYRRHLATFLSAARHAYLKPFVGLVAIFFLLLVESSHMPARPMHYLVFALKGHLVFVLLAVLYGNMRYTALCTLIVEKLRVAPLSTVALTPIIDCFKWRRGGINSAARRGGWHTFTQAVRLVVPGWRAFVDSSLATSVAVMEGIHGEDALARARDLANRLRPVTTQLRVRELFYCALALLVFHLVFAILFHRSFVQSPYRLIAIMHFIIAPAGTALFLLIVQPIISIAQAITYFKARQCTGEALVVSPDRNFESALMAKYPRLSYNRVALLLTLLVIALSVITVTQSRFQTALLPQMAERGRVDMVRTLIANGADIDVKDDQGKSALIYAAWGGDLEMVKLLIAAGANVNDTDVSDAILNESFFRPSTTMSMVLEGKTPLIHAAEQGRTEVAKELLKAGALPDLKSFLDGRYNRGRTALMHAARSGHVEIVKMLLAAGAEVNEVCFADNMTALKYAASEGHTGIVKVLIEADALRYPFTADRVSPLMLAARAGYANTVKALLDARVTLNETDKEGRNALHYALSGQGYGHYPETERPAHTAERVKIVKLLVDAGVEVNSRAADGNTALTLAITYPELAETVDILTAAGAAVNVRDAYGLTPLMKAAMKGNSEAVRRLLAAGADRTFKASDGKTAYMMAQMQGHKEAAELLQ